MPSVDKDKQALDWLVQNPNHQEAPRIKQKLGVEDIDVQAWDFAQNNPEHERTTIIKNKIFDKVAQANPAVQEQGVGFLDRFKIKNLISENTDLQQKYLQGKGFETRLVDDQVQIRQPGDPRFQVIDPEGFDMWDVTDLVGDAAEALVTGVATGAKALGLVGAPATGGLSIPATSALGAAATGGFETARQGVGIATGLREELDPGRIAQATVLGGTIPGAAKLGGAALKGISKIGQKISGAKLKPTAETVQEAGQVLGTKPTPGQLIDQPYLQQLETAQAQRGGTAGGTFLRRKIKKNIEATRKVASSILDDAGVLSKSEAGADIFQSITKNIEKRLEPAEKIYQTYADDFGEFAAKKEGLRRAITDFYKKKKGDFKLKGFLKNLSDSLENDVKTIADIKEFKTTLGGMLESGSSKNQQEAVRFLYGPASKALDDSILAIAKTKGPKFAEKAFLDIQQAKQLYRSVFDDINAVVFKPGQVAKLSPKVAIKKEFKKITDINAVANLLPLRNPAKAAEFAKRFPEAFEIARQNTLKNINDIVDKSEFINPGKLSTILEKLEPETLNLIFKENAALKAKALGVWLKSLPKLNEVGNPPRTAITNAILKVGSTVGKIPGLGFILDQVGSLGPAAMRKVIANPVLGDGIFMKTGAALSSQTARTVGVLGARQLTPPPRDNRGLNLPPRRGLETPKQ